MATLGEMQYWKAVNTLRTWQNDGLPVDYSYPSGSIGDHLVYLLNLGDIADLMRSPAVDALSNLLAGPDAFYNYLDLFNQRIPVGDG
jgi:hypothetical protein